ncbi:MAG: serine hydrolase [Gammaproteobacteria bacterium]|nr:serine hydrolase [Gammaproteobacteria bacterium]
MSTLKKISRYFAAFGLLCCLSTSPASYAEELQEGFSKERLQRLNIKFNSLIKNRKNAGFTALIYRNNKQVHKMSMGWQDIERKIPMRADSIFRIYSMSKAITSIAALILYEEGHFQIDQAVADFIPEFNNIRVYKSGEGDGIKTADLHRPVTIRDLFIHTSGLTYHFLGNTAVHKLYRQQGVMPGVEELYPEEGDASAITDLDAMVKTLSRIPLLHQPGERMSYSVSIDVLGRVIEVISGQPLDQFMHERIFKPLKMKDTGFVLPQEKLNRFTANYSMSDGQIKLIDDPLNSQHQRANRIHAGGAGLVSTAHDYMQFQLMILNGGKLGSARILGPKTLDFALSNHFPIDDLPRPVWMKQDSHGLGFALAMNPARMGMLTSTGTADWAGAASTFFWIDRNENLAAVFMTQDMPIKNNLLIELGRTLTYQALVE